MLNQDEREAKHAEEQVRMFHASGRVSGHEPIIAFIYTLLRDHLTPGTIEDIMLTQVPVAGVKTTYSNGWLAHYAADVARRLLAPAPVVATSVPTPDPQAALAPAQPQDPPAPSPAPEAQTAASEPAGGEVTA